MKQLRKNSETSVNKLTHPGLITSEYFIFRNILKLLLKHSTSTFQSTFVMVLDLLKFQWLITSRSNHATPKSQQCLVKKYSILCLKNYNREQLFPSISIEIIDKYLKQTRRMDMRKNVLSIINIWNVLSEKVEKPDPIITFN